MRVPVIGCPDQEVGIMPGVRLRRRFWIEVIAFALASFVTVLTVARPDWIEAIFHVEPDAGSGALEVGISVVACTAAITFSLMARAEFRRAGIPPVPDDA
jgi:hypothetical protein